jgi:hypothetical protein
MAKKSTNQDRRKSSREKEQFERLEKLRNERVQKYLVFEEDIEDDEVASVEKALRASAYLLRLSAESTDGVGPAGCLGFSIILSDAAKRVSWIAAHPERHFHNATFE